MRFTINDVNKCVKKVGLPIKQLLFTAKDLQIGMEVELEHGKITQITNVTNDDMLMTFKIALAHLLEFPDYYVRLKKLEKEADIYWKNKSKTK